MTQVNTIFGNFKEDDLKIIRDGIEEISNHLTKIQDEKTNINDIIGSLYDQYKLPKKLIRRMAKVYHRQSFTEEVTEDNEFEALYTGVNEVK